MTSGALVLVGTPIGNLGDLTPRAIETLRDADVIACEDTRRTRALLTHAGVPSGRRLRSLDAHREREAAAALVDVIRRGARVAYVTDAGMPGISDPGAALVRACLDAGLAVSVVPGPSAVLTALVLSGLPTHRFTFDGFLPRDGRARSERLAEIAAERRTVVLFEAPHRLEATLADLAAACGRGRPVAVARELTKTFEDVWRGSLGDAARRAREGDNPRGEHVLVIAPASEPREHVTDELLELALRDELAAGGSVRDAAAEVAADLGVPRRRAYELATRLRRRER